MAGPAPDIWPQQALAYVEWYPPLKPAAEPDHKMYNVHPHKHVNGSPADVIIPLVSICQSCMLFPLYGRQVDCSWTSDSVLDNCPSFLVDNWSSLYTYQSVW